MRVGEMLWQDFVLLGLGVTWANGYYIDGSRALRGKYKSTRSSHARFAGREVRIFSVDLDPPPTLY